MFALLVALSKCLGSIIGIRCTIYLSKNESLKLLLQAEISNIGPIFQIVMKTFRGWLSITQTKAVT